MAKPTGKPRAVAKRIAAGGGLAAFVVVCCATLPLVIGLVGGLTLAGVLGVSGGVVAAAAAGALVFLAVRARRRRACTTEDPMDSAIAGRR